MRANNAFELMIDKNFFRLEYRVRRLSAREEFGILVARIIGGFLNCRIEEGYNYLPWFWNNDWTILITSRTLEAHLSTSQSVSRVVKIRLNDYFIQFKALSTLVCFITTFWIYFQPLEYCCGHHDLKRYTPLFNQWYIIIHKWTTQTFNRTFYLSGNL